MAKQIELQTTTMLRPVIGFRLIIRHGTIISLVLENTGKSTATKIELKLDRDFFQFAENSEKNNLRNFSAFNKEIKSMASNDTITFDLAQGFNFGVEENNKILTPHEFTIKMKYCFGDILYEEIQHIDIKPYMSSLAVHEPLEHLESISKSLKKIAG